MNTKNYIYRKNERFPYYNTTVGEIKELKFVIFVVEYSQNLENKERMR